MRLSRPDRSRWKSFSVGHDPAGHRTDLCAERAHVRAERAGVGGELRIDAELVHGGKVSTADQLLDVLLVERPPGVTRFADHVAIADHVFASVHLEPQQRGAVALMASGAVELVHRSGNRLLSFVDQDELQRRLASIGPFLGPGFRQHRRWRRRSRRPADFGFLCGDEPRTRLGSRRGPGHEAERHEREDGGADGGGGDRSRSGSTGRELLEHRDPPLQMQERPGRAGGGARLGPRHAEREQETTVFTRRGVERLDHGGVARRFARQRVLARNEMRERMKEEQPLGERRHAPEPEIRALDVRQLVADGHLLLARGQRREPLRRQYDHRPPQAGDERRLHRVRDPHLGGALQPEPRSERAGAPLHLGGCHGGTRKQPRRLAPAPQRHERDETQTCRPGHHCKGRPLPYRVPQEIGLRHLDVDRRAPRRQDDGRIGQGRDHRPVDRGRQNRQLEGGGPDQRQQELGRRAPPQHRPRCRREPDQTGQQPHRTDNQGAVE